MCSTPIKLVRFVHIYTSSGTNVAVKSGSTAPVSTDPILANVGNDELEVRAALWIKNREVVYWLDAPPPPPKSL